MTRHTYNQRLDGCLAENRSGATSLLFAIMSVPLILILGIAIDFGFYIDASAKLNLAADAAAMHAVRAASMWVSNGAPSYQIAGTQAGYDWFAAQAGAVTEVALNKTTALPGTDEPGQVPVSVNVTYTAPTYSATVTYSGTISTGVLGNFAGIKSWPIAGTATSTISNNFVDFGIMIDNSQSMLIGATPSDINAMNYATPCAVVTPTAQGTYPGLSMINYTYYFNGPAYQPQLTNGLNTPPNYGYGFYTNANGKVVADTVPLPTNQQPPPLFECDPNLINPNNSVCAYPPSFIYQGPTQNPANPLLQTKAQSNGDLPGACKLASGAPGGGAPGAAGPHTPQAPCAFACHQNANGGDWYAVARNTINPTTNNPVQLRLDVIQSAAQNLLTTMKTYSAPPQTLLGVGIYTFNSTFQPVYPCSSSGCQQFGTDLDAASDILNVCTGNQTSGCLLPPVTTDQPNTDFPDVFAAAATFLKGTSGNGLSPATAKKNLFIITDGISDWPPSGQVVGPMDQLEPLQSDGTHSPCTQLKSQGFTIYVLYTPYEPIPTWTYSYWPQPQTATYPGNYTLQNFATIADPTTFPNYNANYPSDTPVAAALRACATDHDNGFYVASDSMSINKALQNMLAIALNAAARVTN